MVTDIFSLCFAHSTSNIAAVSESVAEDLKVYISQRYQELGHTQVRGFLFYLESYQHPYIVKLTQQLKPAYHSERRTYAD